MGYELLNGIFKWTVPWISTYEHPIYVGRSMICLCNIYVHRHIWNLLLLSNKTIYYANIIQLCQKNTKDDHYINNTYTYAFVVKVQINMRTITYHIYTYDNKCNTHNGVKYYILTNTHILLKSHNWYQNGISLNKIMYQNEVQLFTRTFNKCTFIYKYVYIYLYSIYQMYYIFTHAITHITVCICKLTRIQCYCISYSIENENPNVYNTYIEYKYVHIYWVTFEGIHIFHSVEFTMQTISEYTHGRDNNKRSR